MLKRKSISLAFLALIYHSTTAAQTGSPAFSLSIVADPASSRSGATVELSIALTNKSQKEIFIPTDMSHAESTFHIRITDPKGEEAGKTRYYRNITGDKSGKDAAEPPLAPLQMRIVLGSGGILHPLPGQTVSQRVILNEMFDLAQPGAYTVQVDKMDDISKTLVKSNVVTFSVTNQ